MATAGTLVRDSLEWLEWTPRDFTEDDELLKALEDEELATLGAAWEALCSGVIKIPGLREAFDVFFEQHPEFSRVDHQPEPDLPEPVEAVDAGELARLRGKEKLLDKIRRMAAKSRKLHADLVKAKDCCKEIKRYWEEAVSTLTLLCDSAKTGQMLLPVEEDDEEEDEDRDEGLDDDEPEGDEDAWRDTPLDDLGISDGVLGLLREAGVDSVGELEDLRAKIAGGKADWPKGIGEAKVTQIENAVLQWLASHGK